jgi:hypothetical protein
VCCAIHSNARLHHRPAKGIRGEAYFLQLDNDETYDDLLALGLIPNKSHTILMPKVPEPYIRHFIRGCWDGDGSVYVSQQQGKPRFAASFVSGSQLFIEQFLDHLVLLGLPRVTIHKDARTQSAWYFRFSGSACVTLFHLLYDGVGSDLYLSRKFELFRTIAAHYENQIESAV